MRSTTLSALLLVAGCASSTTTAPATTAPSAETATSTSSAASLAPILAAAHRDEDRARDAERHPAETLAFFGVTPDKDVLELAPGGGWYTRILAPFVRDEGSLTVALPDGRYGDAFRALAATDPDFYGHIGTVRIAPPDHIELGESERYDVVLTFRNSHSWVKDGVADAIYAEVFRVLRPGGVFGVVQHRRAGELDPASGYLPEAYVIEAIERAGFILDGRSEVNANPRDTGDHPEGVWSLPPSLRGGETDAAHYNEIGESDRMTLRFVKPAS